MRCSFCRAEPADWKYLIPRGADYREWPVCDACKVIIERHASKEGRAMSLLHRFDPEYKLSSFSRAVQFEQCMRFLRAQTRLEHPRD